MALTVSELISLIGASDMYQVGSGLALATVGAALLLGGGITLQLRER